MACGLEPLLFCSEISSRQGVSTSYRHRLRYVNVRGPGMLATISTMLGHLQMTRQPRGHSGVVQRPHVFAEIVATYQSQIVMSGDFNVHIDDPDDRHRLQLLELLDTFDLRQSVKQSTYRGDTRWTSSSHDVTYHLDPGTCHPPVFSDHGLVSCCIPSVSFATWGNQSKTLRHWKRMDNVAF